MYQVQFPGLGWEFSISPVAFRIGDIPITWYGVIIATGLLLAVFYVNLSCKKFRVDSDKVFDCIFIGLIGGIIGARLYYVLFYPGDRYLNDPKLIFDIRSGGLAIYGGIIGGLLFGVLTAKLRKLKIPAVLDLAALGLLIGQCLGRWGNFMNQEAFGTETDLPWGMISEGTRVIADGPVHPCFFYESMWCLLGFVLLHFFSRKLRHYDGQAFLLYIVWYGAGRFFIEGLRTDSLLTPFFNLRVSQLVAIVTVAAGLILLFVFRKSTNLDGCGSKTVMEMHALSSDIPEDMIVAEDAAEEEKPALTLDADDTEDAQEAFETAVDKETQKSSAVIEDTLMEEQLEDASSDVSSGKGGTSGED